MTYTALTRAFAVCLMVAFSVLIATAQISNQLNTGYPENGIFHGSDIDNVQVKNGNLHVERDFVIRLRNFAPFNAMLLYM